MQAEKSNLRTQRWHYQNLTVFIKLKLLRILFTREKGTPLLYSFTLFWDSTYKSFSSLYLESQYIWWSPVVPRLCPLQYGQHLGRFKEPNRQPGDHS